MTPVLAPVYWRVDPAEEAADMQAAIDDLYRKRHVYAHAVRRGAPESTIRKARWQLDAAERGLARMKGETT